MLRKKIVPFLILLLLFSSISSLQVLRQVHADEEFVKESMPDFGQHCSKWCWVAALANSLYWYKHTGGYPNLYPDSWDTENISEPGCPTPAGGYRRLLKEIADAAGKEYCQSIGQTEYLNGIQRLLDDLNSRGQEYCYDLNSQGQEYCFYRRLVLHVIESPEFDPLTIFGPEGPYEPPEIQPLDPLIQIWYRHPTFDDYARELKRSQDVILCLGDGDPTTMDHVVTGVSYRINQTTGHRFIKVADPWTHKSGHDDIDPGKDAPDHNNNPSHDKDPYEEYNVTSTDPLVINHTNSKLRMVLKLILISPEEPVGGVVFAADKISLLAPYASLLMAAVAITIVVGVKKRWLRTSGEGQ